MRRVGVEVGLFSGEFGGFLEVAVRELVDLIEERRCRM